MDPMDPYRCLRVQFTIERGAPQAHWEKSALLVAAFLLIAPVGAAEAGEIGFFDSERLLVESKKLTGMRAEWEAKRVTKEKELETARKALEDFVYSAKKGSGKPQLPGEAGQITGKSLPPEKLPQSKALNETLNRLQRETFELRAQARDALRTWILNAVRAFARKQGYSIVFDQTRAGVVHIDDEVNVTQRLIQWIDKSG